MAQSIVFRESFVNGIHLNEDISSCHFNLNLLQSRCFNAWFRRFKVKNLIPELRATVQYANSNFFDDFRFQHNVVVEMDFISANANFIDVRFRFYDEGFEDLKAIVIQRMLFEMEDAEYFLPVHMVRQLNRLLIKLEVEDLVYA